MTRQRVEVRTPLPVPITLITQVTTRAHVLLRIQIETKEIESGDSTWTLQELVQANEKLKKANLDLKQQVRQNVKLKLANDSPES